MTSSGVAQKLIVTASVSFQPLNALLGIEAAVPGSVSLTRDKEVLALLVVLQLCGNKNKSESKKVVE